MRRVEAVVLLVVLSCFAQILADTIQCTTANLNLRAQPSTSARIIKTLPKGTSVNVISVTPTGWAQLLDGYLSMAYLTNCSNPAASPEISTEDEVLYSTRGPKPHMKCEGTNSTTCYSKLYVPLAMNMLTVSYDQRFHISDVFTFKELCNHTAILIDKLEAVSSSKFTCIRYFNDSSLIEFAQHPQVAYRPITFQSWQSVYMETWWAPHFDIRNYCTYCQHSTRDQFLQLVNDYKLPYYWKHSRQVGDDGSNAIENPTILAKVHLQYIHWYKKQPGRNGTIRGDPQRNLTDYLRLTKQRNYNQDDIGEENRIEYPYNIYCSSWNLWGTRCDSYIWFWNPFRYHAWPIMDYIVRIIMLLCILCFTWIPRIQYHIKAHIRSIKNIPRFVYEILSDIKIHTMLFMTIGIAFIIVEDSADFKTTQGEFHSWRGVFRVVSGASTATGFLSLLVFWSHVYHCSQALSMDDKMNIWNKLTLLVFYLSIVIMCVVAAILYVVIADYRAWIFVSIMGFAVIFFSILVVGFLVYGLRMYCMLKIDTKMNFFKLKFTKFMLIIMVLFMNYIIWTLIMAVETAIPGNLSLFFALMKNPVMDFSSLILYPFVIYILFDRNLFFEVRLFGAIRDGCYILLRRTKTCLRREKKPISLRDVEEDEDAELRTGLMTGDELPSKHRIQI